MDKRTIIGIALIVVITLLMPFYQRWITGDRELPQDRRPVAKRDTSVISRDTTRPEATPEPLFEEAQQPEKNLSIEDSTVFVQESEQKKTIEIESENFRIVWSTEKGANPVSWVLKKYKHHTNGSVDLMNDNRMKIHFLNADGKQMNLDDFNWHADFISGRRINLNERNPVTEIKFYMPMQNGRVEKIIRLYYDRYAFDMALRFVNLDQFIINRRYFIGWENGLPATEQNVSDDLSYSRAYAYMAEELYNIDASDNYDEKDFNGRVDWAAVRTKYFLVSFIPSSPSQTNGVTIGGVKTEAGEMEKKNYNFSIDMSFRPLTAFADSFTVYMGPLDYYILRKYDVELQSLVMNKDWYERLFRPISLLIIPAFKFLHRFIPNYGMVIIVFSILIKLILHPLTKKSYQSMSEMQYLQPKMMELREKYKNEPQRLNKEMMKLYREHGVNPLGGCLPMLLQMPVLFSLFIVFRSTIQLRGKPFALWINDLSAPDVLHIGVSLPLIGDSIHVLPVLMGLTMIWQSKMTMTDPKQKMMVYFMPVFLVFIFYSLPSGLNLYYAVFNLLSMAQTRYIKKKTHPDNGDKQDADIGKPKKQPKGKN